MDTLKSFNLENEPIHLTLRHKPKPLKCHGIHLHPTSAFQTTSRTQAAHAARHKKACTFGISSNFLKHSSVAKMNASRRFTYLIFEKYLAKSRGLQITRSSWNPSVSNHLMGFAENFPACLSRRMDKFQKSECADRQICTKPVSRAVEIENG